MKRILEIYKKLKEAWDSDKGFQVLFKNLILSKFKLPVTGIKGYLASKVIDWFYESVLEPLYKMLRAKVIVWRRKKSRAKAKVRYQDAKTQEEQDAAFDDFISGKR